MRRKPTKTEKLLNTPALCCHCHTRPATPPAKGLPVGLRCTECRTEAAQPMPFKMYGGVDWFIPKTVDRIGEEISGPVGGRL